MLTGCIMPLAYGRVHRATVRVLARNGCEVIAPPDAGLLRRPPRPQRRHRTRARRWPAQNIDAFLDGDVDAIVVNSAGCGAR